MNGIRGNKFIHEMMPTALICQSNAPNAIKCVVRSTQSAKKGTVISSIHADEEIGTNSHQFCFAKPEIGKTTL